MKTKGSFLPLVFALILGVGAATPVLAVEDPFESDLQIHIESDVGAGVGTDVAIENANVSWVRIEPKPLDIRVPEFFRWAGNLLWEIVKDSRPIVDTSTTVAHAIPARAGHWADLAGWEGPVLRQYDMAVKNAFQQTVVRLKYAIQYHYNGRYEGHGRYLANLSVMALEAEARQGYRLYVKATAETPINVGTIAEPVAELPLKIQIDVGTLRTRRVTTVPLSIRADGSAHTPRTLEFVE